MFNRREKLILFILASAQFNNIVDFIIMMPLGPQLMREFDMSAQQFGFLISSYTFTAGITGFLAAFFLDNFDRKRALLALNTGFALGTLACAAAPTFELLLAARSITGAFGGIMGSLVLASVGDAISAERRGTAMGVVMTAFSAASVFGVPISLALSNVWNWHAPFVILGSAALAISGVIAWAFPPMRGHLGRIQHKPWKTIVDLLRLRRTRNVLVFMALLIFGQFTIIPFISPSLVANVGFPEKHLFLIYLIGGAITLFTNPFYGRMTDKFGPRKVAMIGIPLSIIPVVLVTNLGVTPEIVVYAFIALFFVTMGGRIVPASTMATSAVPPEKRGTYMSLVSCCQQLASATAASVAGKVIVKSASGELMYYPRLGVISVCASVVAWLVLYSFLGAATLHKDEPGHVGAGELH